MRILASLAILGLSVSLYADVPRQVSGIYPHLAMFNNEGECGTGAVVPWADRLWVVTYGPHCPWGSSDKLYEITPDLTQIVRTESIGGTPANRMIHRETNQLLIGPYVVDASRNVRVIPIKAMPGRLTANARDLDDPTHRALYATMEEALYSVDLRTLEVEELIKDGNNPKEGGKRDKDYHGVVSTLPGYHGKGLYSGQGRVVYANNGEYGEAALTNPATPSGALAEWRKPGDNWTMVRRNQFTEITGPGGIYGNEHPGTDPLWTIGWDFRSLILMCLDGGEWHSYRLPKGSHSYDGAHGWNTEWPRIRDVGGPDLLMTMHGTFWHFPKTFSVTNSAGIAPRSNYLKVIGDFTRWNDRIVMGCDDTAKSEFLNKRKAKGEISAPGQSHSNLWFVAPETLDQLGPVIGRGAVWLNDAVKAGDVSDPYLFSGYAYRSLNLSHNGAQPVAVELQVDAKGNGQWTTLRTVNVAPKTDTWVEFPASEQGAWIRLKPQSDAARFTAFFQYRNADDRQPSADAMFAGIPTPADTSAQGGLVYVRGNNTRTLRYVARDEKGVIGCYDLDGSLQLKPMDDPQGVAFAEKTVPIPTGVLSYDDASVIYQEGKVRRRLPRGDAAFDRPSILGDERVCREVCTERDLFNAGGTFFELPAENAGGAAKIRPITTHNRRIKDYASYRGLIVISGLRSDVAAGEHVIRSTDGKAALWVGEVDDLWKFGKPRGVGGPWKNTAVTAGKASDAYLMTGYDKKTLTLSHTANESVAITVEVDVSGTGDWQPYQTFDVPAGKSVEHRFPAAFGAYWVRLVANHDCTATGQLVYQ